MIKPFKNFKAEYPKYHSNQFLIKSAHSHSFFSEIYHLIPQKKRKSIQNEDVFFIHVIFCLLYINNIFPHMLTVSFFLPSYNSRSTTDDDNFFFVIIFIIITRRKVYSSPYTMSTSQIFLLYIGDDACRIISG